MAKATKKSSSAGSLTSKRAASNSRTPVKLDEDWTVARRISWYALLACVFLVPIVMSNWTWLGFKLPISYDQFDIIKVTFQRILGLVALAAWGWDILKRGGKIRRTPIDWLILVFLGWVTISMFLSISPATALFGKYRRFEGLLSFINYAVLYFLVLQFADSPKRIRSIAESLFWSSFVVSGYGLLQSIGRDPINWHALPFEQFRPFSTYGNPDLLGGFLMFSLPVALALALAEDESIWVRLVYWIGFGINAYVWIVSFTRGAWIGGAVGVILVIIVAWRHSTKLQKIDLAPLGLTVAAGGFAIVKSMSNPNEVMNFGARFASIFKTGEGSGLTRTEIWQAAIKAILNSPLRFIFGYGADTFRLVFPHFKPIEYTRDAGYLSVADNVHDYPLQLASGIGVIGVALLYSIFVWVAIRSARLVFGKSEDKNRIILGGLWCAAAAYLVQLMFGLSVTGNTFLLWVCMGAVLAPTAYVVEVESPSWGMAAAAALLAIAAGGIGYQFILQAADYQYLISEISLQSDPQTSVITAEKAVALNPWNDMYLAQVGMAQRQLLSAIGEQYYQAAQSGQDTSRYVQPMQQAFDAAIVALKRTIDVVPDEYDNYVFISSTYNLGASLLNKPAYYDESIAWAKRGMAVEPFGPAIRTQYATALAGKGQHAEAIKALEAAFAMDQMNADAGRTLAAEYATVGRISDAEKVLQGLIDRGTTDASITQLLQQIQQQSKTATATTATP